MPPQPIASRGMFDREHNALPVITVFDPAVASAAGDAAAGGE